MTRKESESEADFISDWCANADHLNRTGLYNPSDEHDACGVGLVAAIDGKPRREVVEKGVEALSNVWHRGAVDADGKTGEKLPAQVLVHLQTTDLFSSIQETT